MVLYCDYSISNYNHGETFYKCQIAGQNIPENKSVEISGEHMNGKSARNVHEIQFRNCKIIKFPQGMNQLFPNLKVINIYNSKLKTINRNDLAEFVNLEMITCVQNELEYLPGDLFVGLKKLNCIYFPSNNLTFIEPNILNGLQNLKLVDFSNNPKYTKCYSIYQVYKPNATLAEVKNELFDKFNIRFNISKENDKSKESLMQEVQQLKDFRAILDQQVKQIKLDQTLCQQLRDNEVKLNKQIQQSRNAERNLRQKNQQLEESLEEVEEENNELQRKNNSLDCQVDCLMLSNEEYRSENYKMKESAAFQADLIDDFKTYIEDESTKDIKIIIKGQELSVHKFLLAARSPTLAEKLKNNPENLDLPEITVEIFEKILKFLYTDELPGNDGTNFLHLYAAAEKLKIQKLKDFALQKGLAMINSENVLEAYKIGHKNENLDIKNKAVAQMKRMYPEVKGEIFGDSNKVFKIIKLIDDKKETLEKVENEFKASLTMELEEVENN